MRSLRVIFYFLLVLSISCGDSKKEVKTKSSVKIEDEVKKTVSSKPVILFFGNSLTAGYGLETTEAFPALIGQKLDSLGFEYEVINAGLSGETTSGGLNRIEWILNQRVDIFVLELGANDGLRGIPISETRKNLQAIIDVVRSKNSETKIILTGMQLPPNMGPEYTNGFKNIFPELAEQNNIELVPFLLQGVGGILSLNQQDGIHPTAKGHKILASNVWNILKEIIVSKEQSN